MSAAPKPEFVGWHEALSSLEDPINRVLQLAQTLTVLMDEVFPDCEERRVSELQNKALGFIAGELLTAADKLDDLWLTHWNASPDDELTAALKVVAAANVKAKVPVVGEAR